VAGLLEQIEVLRGEASRTSSSEEKIGAADFYQIVRRLSPRDDMQRALKAEVVRLSLEVGQVRAAALAQETTSIPVPLLIVLTFWLVILFIGFGLFAPLNLTVMTSLFVFAFQFRRQSLWLSKWTKALLELCESPAALSSTP
jgi:hypothetical protein